MPDSGLGPPGVGELSRQVREVLSRFEMLVTKLETQFVTRDFFTLHSDGVKSEQGHLRASVDQLEKAEKERNDQLERRIKQLEDNQKWIVRLVLAAVIVAVLAAVGFSKSAGGA